jgi:hypothetical protein
MYGTYLLIFLILGAFIIWPQETEAVLTTVSLKIQIYWINYRMRRKAYQVYSEIVRLSKEAGFPHPGEFKYTNLWDREAP